MKHFVKQFILFAILFLTIQTAHGSLIIDTGPASSAKEAWVLTNEQFLAAEFVLGQSYSITDVQGWIGSNTNGNLIYRIRKDDSTSGEIPGSIIYSQAFELPFAEDADWYGPSGLNWNLSAGTYWLSFEVDVNNSEGFQGWMPFPANFPLSNYAFSPNADGYTDWYQYDELKFGVRIYGERHGANVPEPAIMLLLGLGLMALAGSRRFKN
jgi:hypothetical protein